MRTVRDGDDNRYQVLKVSGDAYLLRDPATGEERYRPAEELEPIDDRDALGVAAEAVPESVRRVLASTHDDRSLGLLIEIVDRGPMSVLELLDEYTLCESDLHGLCGELRAAGLIAETTVNGHRGYEATPIAIEGIETLRAGDRASNAGGDASRGDKGV